MRKWWHSLGLFTVLCLVACAEKKAPEIKQTYVETHIEAYLVSLDLMAPEQLLATEKIRAFVPHETVYEIMSEGQFALNAKLVENLQAAPVYRKKIAQAAKRAGFKDLTQWAAFADFVTNTSYAARDTGQCTSMRLKMAEMIAENGGIPAGLEGAFETSTLLCRIVDMTDPDEAAALMPYLDDIAGRMAQFESTKLVREKNS